MKSLKKSGLLVLAVSSLALAACGGKDESVKYERGSDEKLYTAALGEYEELAELARAIANDDERFVAYAAAEAALLDSGVMIPTTTQNGAYAITRVAPRTVPYVSYGIDEDKLKGVVAVAGAQDNFIKSDERAEMLALWEAAVKGGAAYDPAAYLTGKGYSIANTYKTTFSSAPQTLDILGTSRQADTEYLTNGIEGLVSYNNLGQLRGAGSTYVVDGVDVGFYKETVAATETTAAYDVYHFPIREGQKWVNNEGVDQGAVTADDFVAGFQHMLDAQGGLDYLVDGIVVGVSDYLKKKSNFDAVGFKASDDGKEVVITLTKTESFFPTRLVYSCFMPLKRSFYESKGGVFGIDALAQAKTAGTYKYGITSDAGSILYNGAFRCTKLDLESEIKFARNTAYWNDANTTINEISWIYDAGEDPDQTYADVRSGVYPGMSLSASTGTLDYAKRDGIFDGFKYITETNATTYFGGMNLNRGTFELASGGVKSSQSEAQKIAIHKAMNNKNFRKAIQHGWDRAAYNAVSRGSDLATTNLRNMYTKPDFVKLAGDINFAAPSTEFKAFLDYEIEISLNGIKQKVSFLEACYALYSARSADGLFKEGCAYADMVQGFLDIRAGSPYVMGPVNVADGQDGWYNAKLAREYFWDYILEAGSDFPSEGLVIDNVYYGGSTAQTAQANAFKQSLEESFTIAGKKYVTVNLIAASTVNDYYYSGYYCESGEELNQDIFYGSGWGPDYADPSTYLDTFERTAGYMVMVIGINNHEKSVAAE
ncbi:MAG: hypothetical protein K5906_03985 [Bacilli bacterium]|nr:hypothetical protein [Bacilli bacterium]